MEEFLQGAAGTAREAGDMGECLRAMEAHAGSRRGAVDAGRRKHAAHSRGKREEPSSGFRRSRPRATEMEMWMPSGGAGAVFWARSRRARAQPRPPRAGWPSRDGWPGWPPRSPPREARRAGVGWRRDGARRGGSRIQQLYRAKSQCNFASISTLQLASNGCRHQVHQLT